MFKLRVFAAAVLSLALATGEAAAAAEKKKGGGSSYVQLETAAAMVVRSDGRRGVLTVESGVDVKDPSLRARAEALKPRLRDAYVAAIQSHAGGLAAGAPPHADRLSADLQRETDRVLGKPGAKLLLGSLILN
jgi:flagellar basal body-associated protein FliL